MRLWRVHRAFEFVQRVFCAVEQARFEVVKGERMLGPVAVLLDQIAARQQVLVHPHGPFVFATPAKQVAKRKVQLRGVGVVLNGFDEGVDGLVLLLVEQVVQAFEIGLGGLPIFQPQLTQV